MKRKKKKKKTQLINPNRQVISKSSKTEVRVGLDLTLNQYDIKCGQT